MFDHEILTYARNVLQRHGHGISASCTPVCYMTPAERRQHANAVNERFAAEMGARS